MKESEMIGGRNVVAFMVVAVLLSIGVLAVRIFLLVKTPERRQRPAVSTHQQPPRAVPGGTNFPGTAATNAGQPALGRPTIIGSQVAARAATPGSFSDGSAYVARGQIRRTPLAVNTGHTEAAPAHLRHTLSALAAIESGDRPAAIGRHGERGRFQMSQAAWRQSCRLLGCRHAFSLAHGKEADRHAAAYCYWISKSLTRAGVAPTPQTLFAAWNLGPLGFRRAGFNLSRVPATRDAAERFSNLAR